MSTGDLFEKLGHHHGPAVEKWFEMEPEIFKQNSRDFKNKIIFLKPIENPSFHKQPCET
ncbi:MAG TPA: hypothetical protein PLO31_04845 [Dysgonamonadaceae bacterium]|nr:hypothetical protein [Dysgonamonadaceae bacterium]